MSKDLILPQGVKIIDNVLYFGDRQVSCYGDPYKFSHMGTMCTKFAVRYGEGRLCTTLDLVLYERTEYINPLIWLCGVELAGGKSLPSAYYSDWRSVEYVLNTFAVELQGQEWFIVVDDENYAWDDEKGVFRRQTKIETVGYVWTGE